MSSGNTAASGDRIYVVGGGIVGICSGLSLLEKGLKVTLVDRDAPGQGTSSGNAGVISPWSIVPQAMPGVWKSIPRWLLDPEGPVSVRPGYLLKVLPWALRFLREAKPEKVTATAAAMAALTHESVDLFKYHLSGTGHENLVQDSYYVHVYRRQQDANPDDLGWRIRKDHGAELEFLRGGEVQDLEPALSPDVQAAVVIKNQARALSPGRIGTVLTEKFCGLGGEVIRTQVEALKPMDDGRWRIVTESGDHTAAKVVLAAGAWSRKLLAPLGIDVPLEAERGYHLVFKNPGVELSHSIMDVDGKFVTSLMDAGVRSAGTAEFAGLEAPPDYRRARIFKRLTKRLLPGLNTDDAIEWMGVRPSFPDSLPCLGEVPAMPGLFAAFGHSHYGLMMAPRTGQVVAQLVSGTKPNIDVAPYRVDRFGA